MTTAFAAPATPTNLTLTPADASSVILRWQDNSTDETAFIIGARNSPTGSFTILTTAPANAVEITLPNVPEGSVQEFVVVAQDALNGQSPLSGIVSRTFRLTFFSAISGEVNKPFNFTIAAAGPSAVTSFQIAPLPEGLIFNAATGAITGTPLQTGTAAVTVTATREGGETVTGPLALRVFAWQEPPAAAPPVLAEAPVIGPLSLSGGPKTVSLAAVFRDPDAASAVRVTTDSGVMDFILYPEAAPQTVANFLGYVNRGDYTNSIFHRSVPDFVIQGGGFRADATASPVPTVASPPNEPQIRNRRGTVSMAKLGSDPNSATCQFFVSLADNGANLDNQNNGFTVFGRVAGTGMTVADAIAALPRKNFSAVNGALNETPVRADAAAYDPGNLVRFQSVGPVAPLSFTAASSAPGIITAEITAEELRLTPVSAGTAEITVTATDLDGLTVSHPFSVNVPANLTYTEWAAAQAFPTPSDAEATADPDRDGSTNFMEYVLGSAPLTAESSAPDAILTPSGGEQFAAIRFQISSLISGTTVSVEAGSGLTGPWETVWESTQGTSHPQVVESTVTGDKIDLTVRDTKPVSAETPRRFLRLKAAGTGL